VPLYIGESVSSSIPSLIVFFQGSTKPDESACTKVKESNEEILIDVKRQYFVHTKHNLSMVKDTGDTVPEVLKTNPNFSVSIFFLIIAALMLISSVAFVYIDLVYARKKLMKEEILTKIDQKQKEIKERESFIKQTTKEKKPDFIVEADAELSKNRHLIEKATLLVISFFISCFMYGILPGIQPYSTLPYGYSPFHLSINLGNLLLPIAVMSSIFSKKDSMKSIVVQFIVGIGFSLYLLVISIMSPCPPFVISNLELGSFLAVFSWILIECIFIRLRCKIAERFERFGGEYFLFLGFVTLLGQVIGGTIIYICIDIYRLFKDKPQCVFDLSYCELL